MFFYQVLSVSFCFILAMISDFTFYFHSSHHEQTFCHSLVKTKVCNNYTENKNCQPRYLKLFIIETSIISYVLHIMCKIYDFIRNKVAPTILMRCFLHVVSICYTHTFAQINFTLLLCSYIVPHNFVFRIKINIKSHIFVAIRVNVWLLKSHPLLIHHFHSMQVKSCCHRT